MKHSGAGRADIVLTSEGERLQINYSDNGKGFNFEQNLQSGSKGLGLQNITGRVNYLNGIYKSEDNRNNGFSISFEFQLPY